MTNNSYLLAFRNFLGLQHLCVTTDSRFLIRVNVRKQQQQPSSYQGSQTSNLKPHAFDFVFPHQVGHCFNSGFVLPYVPARYSSQLLRYHVSFQMCTRILGVSRIYIPARNVPPSITTAECTLAEVVGRSFNGRYTIAFPCVPAR